MRKWILTLLQRSAADHCKKLTVDFCDCQNSKSTPKPSLSAGHILEDFYMVFGIAFNMHVWTALQR